MTDFRDEVKTRLNRSAGNTELQDAARAFMGSSIQAQYSYNFFWLGRPIIQYPQDMIAFQEVVWDVKPDLIIEMGIAHGGSLILSASMLAMLDYCDAVEDGNTLDPRRPQRKVLGVDIDIRAQNRAAIEAHPMFSRIDMIEGSSIEKDIIDKVHEAARGAERVLLCLDSNHTHDHVLAELQAYASLVTRDSYCIVFDTVIEDLPADMYSDRPWGPGDNAKSAVHEFLKSNRNFEIDKSIDHKLMISVAPDGWLKRIA